MQRKKKQKQEDAVLNFDGRKSQLPKKI